MAITTLIRDILIAAGDAQQPGSNRFAQVARFELHAQHARATVAAWPAWKLGLLRGCAMSGKADCRNCTCFDDGPLF